MLAGPVQSGKTTRLIAWSENRNDVYGIVTPVIHGKRFFTDAATKETFAMEADTYEKNVVKVGRYVFSTAAFDRAKKILENAVEQKQGWIIIDEIGPLELRGEGFAEIAKKIIGTEGGDFNIILVVRKELYDTVLAYFNLDPGSVRIFDF